MDPEDRVHREHRGRGIALQEGSPNQPSPCVAMAFKRAERGEVEGAQM